MLLINIRWPQLANQIDPLLEKISLVTSASSKSMSLKGPENEQAAVLLEESASPNTSVADTTSQLLRPGVSKSCFIAFLVAAMMAIAGLVFINTDQTYIMVDILDYPRDKVGSAAGTLAFADEILSVFMVSIWGALSDKIARRWVFGIGLACMALAITLHPWASCVFPHTFVSFFRSLLFFRLIFAMGGSASTAMLTALIGDYAKETSRAKVAGITGIATGLGALFSALVLSRLPTFFARDSNLVPGGLRNIPNGGATLVIAFAIAGSLLFFSALIAMAFLYSPPELELPRENLALRTRIKIGVTAIRRPPIALAYFSSFVARADSIALTLFISPWVDKFMTQQGRCPSVGDSNVLTRCQPAKKLASTLMSVVHLSMLLGAPFFGILADRIGAINTIAIPAGSGLVAFGLLYFLSDPSKPLVYMTMALSGLAVIGMIITSMSLMAALSTPEHRGALSGVYSFFGAIGIIVTSQLGGYLFDRVKETASFLIVAFSSGIVCFLAIIIGIHVRNSMNQSAITIETRDCSVLI